MWHVYDFRLFFSLERLLRTRLKHLRMLVLVLNMLSLRQNQQSGFLLVMSLICFAQRIFIKKFAVTIFAIFFVQYFVDVFQKVEFWCPWNSWYQILKGHATFVECLECIQPYSCLSTSNSTHFLCLLLLIILFFPLESAFRTLHITNE